MKNYGEFCAVNHMSFTVPEGVIFGFLGPNGAGKTTTIKMLTTVLDPTSGSIRVNGHDPTREQKQVRRSFGIVFQDPSLDDELTAYENMDLHGILYGVPRAERHKRIDALVNLVGLGERKKDFVKTYSGGMKRRLEVARALLHKPRILFLDEPTIGLDPQTRNHIWSYIQQLSKEEGVTVFFTTHYMDEADRVASEVAVIDHGKIVAQGSPAELKERTKCANAGRRVHRADRARHSRGGSERNRPHAHDGAGVERRRTPMRAIYILCVRQLKRYIRSPARIIGSLGQPILFLGGAGIRIAARCSRGPAAETTSTSFRRESFPWRFCSTPCFRGSKSSGTGNSAF